VACEQLTDMAMHSLTLDMITRQHMWEPRYGVAPGYGIPAGANDGFQEVFTSSSASTSSNFVMPLFR
jgi:hypothetical protein